MSPHDINYRNRLPGRRSHCAALAGWCALSLLLPLWAGQLAAQTTNPPAIGLQGGGNDKGDASGAVGSTGKAKGKDKPATEVRPTIIGGSSSGAGGNDKAKRPERPADSSPVEVKALVNKFQAAREEFLVRQKELNRQLKEATEEERAGIREQIREQMDRWKEQHRQFVEEARDRARDMKSQLQPGLGRVVDDALKEGRDR